MNIGERLIFLHRTGAGPHALDLSLGTASPIQEFFREHPWPQCTILLEDRNLLGELTQNASSIVADAAKQLIALAGDYQHPLINTIDGFMASSNTWGRSRYTETQMRHARQTPHASLRFLHEATTHPEVEDILSSIRDNMRIYPMDKPNSSLLFAIAWNIANRSTTAKLMNLDAFLRAESVHMEIPDVPGLFCATLPKGINVVLLDPSNDQATRRQEGVLKPTIIFGRYKKLEHQGSSKPMRGAQVINIGNGNRPHRSFDPGARPLVGRSMPLDILASR